MSTHISPEDVEVTDLGDETLGLVGFDVYDPQDEDADRLAIGEWTPDQARRIGLALIAMADTVEADGDNECEGHYDDDYTLMSGAGIGEATYCDGSCRRGAP